MARRTTGEVTTQRPRIAIDIPAELLAEIAKSAKEREQSIREFTLEALQEALTPSVQFLTPETEEKTTASLISFLEGATSIAMFGISLTAVHRPPVQEFLRSQIAKGVSIRLITLDPEVVEENNPIYHFLTTHHTFMYPTAIKETLTTTHTILQALLQQSERTTKSLQVAVTRRLPNAGIIIRDRYTAGRLRVRPYLTIRPRADHPAFEINTLRPQGQRAAALFLQHFDELTAVEYARALSPRGVAKD